MDGPNEAAPSDHWSTTSRRPCTNARRRPRPKDTQAGRKAGQPVARWLVVDECLATSLSIKMRKFLKKTREPPLQACGQSCRLLRLFKRGVQVGNRQTSQARAFTMIELIICIAIVMILLGIWLPSLSRARESVRRTRDLAAIASVMKPLLQYEADYSSFPVWSNDPEVFHVVNNMQSGWTQPFIARQYVTNYEDIDPEFTSGEGWIGVWLSLGLMYPSHWMQPGLVARGQFRPSKVGLADVMFPSDKGAIVKMWHGTPHSSGLRSFCCTRPGWKAPVAFVDGSAVSASAFDLLGNSQLYVEEEWFGVPVLGTWNGALGKDR